MWVSHEPSVSPTCWNWTHTLTSNTKRRLQKKLFNRQADCYSKGGRISPVGPDRKQVWKFWSIFLFKFDLFILKTHFISLWGVSKKHFPCPLCLHFTAIRPFCESQIVTEQQQTVRGFVIENSFKKFHLVFRITSPKGSLEKRILYSQSGLKHCIKPFLPSPPFKSASPWNIRFFTPALNPKCELFQPHLNFWQGSSVNRVYNFAGGLNWNSWFLILNPKTICK